jgi:hypothetical protein
VTNAKFTLYKVSEGLYGVSSTDSKLSQELNRATGYRRYEKHTRFKEGDEPLFHFFEKDLSIILHLLGINVEPSLITYPAA